jgi:hypothetical protein
MTTGPTDAGPPPADRPHRSRPRRPGVWAMLMTLVGAAFGAPRQPPDR